MKQWMKAFGVVVMMVMLLSLAAPAFAEGPVPNLSLPEGVQVVSPDRAAEIGQELASKAKDFMGIGGGWVPYPGAYRLRLAWLPGYAEGANEWTLDLTPAGEVAMKWHLINSAQYKNLPGLYTETGQPFNYDWVYKCWFHGKWTWCRWAWTEWFKVKPDSIVVKSWMGPKKILNIPDPTLVIDTNYQLNQWGPLGAGFNYNLDVNRIPPAGMEGIQIHERVAKESNWWRYAYQFSTWCNGKWKVLDSWKSKWYLVGTWTNDNSLQWAVLAKVVGGAVEIAKP